MAKYSPDIKGKIAKVVHGHITLRPDKSARKEALKNAVALGEKKLEGKIKRNVPGESRNNQIERVNKESRERGIRSKALDRIKRRHLGGAKTSKGEREDFVKRMSAD